MGDHCQSLLRPSCSASLQRRDGEGELLLVFEGGGFTYLSVPPLLSQSVDEKGKLCFLDHQMESSNDMSNLCCLREAGHVHAHVHRGEITEDILLEQCIGEACCTLPVSWDLRPSRTLISSSDEHNSDHKHHEGCGHNRIAHGDHHDWLIPLKDGSYVLSHAQVTANGPQFIEHGRLVKVGESLGRLKRTPKQLIDLFTYEGPKRKGYESLPTAEEEQRTIDKDIVPVMKSPSHGFMALSPPKQAVLQEDTKLTIPRGFKSQGIKKTTFDVMGICCPAEVPLVKKILAPLPGVDEVLVNVTSKTVTVLHDPTIIADVQLVKILNEARLDASIHQRGKRRMPNRWPSPWTICSGILLLISFLHYAWPPLKWVALGAIAVGVPPILVRSLVALRRCVLDINALMIIAVGGAIALGDYVEGGSIAFLFTLADWLETRSTDKARDAISNVADLVPQTAVLMDGKRVAVEDVSIGTLLAVKAGEIIPIDGEVVSGKSSIDESTVTGESKPVEKAMGAVVWAGTMNLSGYISMETTALAEDSAVSRMVRLVEEAQNQHSPTEHLIEKIAKYYTPLVVVSAVLVAVIPLAAGSHRHKHWVYLALVLLVVACPCALVISTPVTTTCGIAQAGRAGLLVRGGIHLEALAKVKVVAMDKTGTLTEGHFRVLDVCAVDNATSVQQILHWIACVESKSSHPLAPALVAYARLHGVEPTGDITDFEIIPGLGVSAVIDGLKVQIGNARLAANFVGFEDIDFSIVETWSSQGATVGWVGVNEQPVGFFGVADSVRPEACEAVASLKKLGMRVVMLTGDSKAAASAARNQIGDIEVHSELLPENKVSLVKELKGTGVIAMVGDGINDAPALALADIGIAMGVAGSAVAMETADVALMTNDLRKLAVAIRLGQSVRGKIIQNVSLSFLTKVTIIILAAVGYPSLWGAVVADVGTCLAVIFNSMRLLNRKKGVVLPNFESKKHRNHNHGHHCYAQGHQDELAQSGNDHQHHHHHQELGKIGGDHHGHLSKSASASDTILSNRKCCTKPDIDNKCSVGMWDNLDNNKCCTRRRGDHKSCPKPNLKAQGRLADTGKEHQHHHQEFGKIGDDHHDHLSKSASASDSILSNRKCCTKPDIDNKCSVGMRDNHDNNKCCTRQRGDHKSCPKPDLKAQPSQVTASGSDCCSGQDLEKKCCPISGDTTGLSSNKESCQSACVSETTPSNRKCSTKADIENNCCGDMSHPVNDIKCCTEQGQDSKCCPMVNLEAQLRPTTAGGSNCCSGQDLEKKCYPVSERIRGLSSNPKSFQSGCASKNSPSNRKCSSKPDIENTCCADMSNPVHNKKCCTGRGQDNKCCTEVNLKAQVSPITEDGSNCCFGQELEKKCCTSLDHMTANKNVCKSATASEISPSNQECCTKPDIEDNSVAEMRHPVDIDKCCTWQGGDSKSC